MFVSEAAKENLQKANLRMEIKQMELGQMWKRRWDDDIDYSPINCHCLCVSVWKADGSCNELELTYYRSFMASQKKHSNVFLLFF